jgi:hypothetical protein
MSSENTANMLLDLSRCGTGGGAWTVVTCCRSSEMLGIDGSC